MLDAPATAGGRSRRYKNARHTRREPPEANGFLDRRQAAGRLRAAGLHLRACRAVIDVENAKVAASHRGGGDDLIRIAIEGLYRRFQVGHLFFKFRILVHRRNAPVAERQQLSHNETRRQHDRHQLGVFVLETLAVEDHEVFERVFQIDLGPAALVVHSLALIVDRLALGVHLAPFQPHALEAKGGQRLLVLVEFHRHFRENLFIAGQTELVAEFLHLSLIGEGRHDLGGAHRESFLGQLFVVIRADFPNVYKTRLEVFHVGAVAGMRFMARLHDALTAWGLIMLVGPPPTPAYILAIMLAFGMEDVILDPLVPPGLAAPPPGGASSRTRS